MFVKYWMVTELVTISPAANLAEAERLFADHRIRRLPVVEDGMLVGILTPGDIEKAMPSILDAQSSSEEEYLAAHTEIRTVMTTSPITISSEEALIDAVRKMRRHNIDGLPVVDDRKLVGIISISDILDAFLEIMSTEGAGTRFDLKIDRDPESFYRLIKVFQRQKKEIRAIFQHHGFSSDHQLITIQTDGSDNDSLIDQLWDNKITVVQVTPVT